MYLVKLISKKRNYFSIGRDYTEKLSLILHSDTLFSALCNNMRKLYGNTILESFLGLLESLENQGKGYFKLSSGLHYIDIFTEGTFTDTIYFFPNPLLRFPLDTSSEEFLEENPKILKKIQFISQEVVRKLQRGQNLSLSQFHIIGETYLLGEQDIYKMGLEPFLSLSESSNASLERIERAIRRKISIFTIVDEQRVRIKRLGGQSEPFTESKLKFYASQYYVQKDGKKITYQLRPGYYFILDVKGLATKLLERVLASIRLIGDEGVGGKRSIGCGLVDGVEITVLDETSGFSDLLQDREEGYFTNISLVYPSREEIDHVKFFNIYGRSGFVYSVENISQRFNDVRFIEEGAIFDKKLHGKLVQVASEEFITQYHKIYKNGYGFYVPIGRLEDE